jgi:hypothetical protein
MRFDILDLLVEVEQPFQVSKEWVVGGMSGLCFELVSSISRRGVEWVVGNRRHTMALRGLISDTNTLCV